ncbi:MAG: phosphatidate cytidylyltransferase [Oscillospiraceae bacterium]|nr:phosphatidate cytidylyltransferase [Oscillospiraceae bacterium]
MSSRILVAVVGIPLVILIVLWSPSWTICAALCALAGLAGLELQQCVSGEKRGVMVALSAVLPVFTVLWEFLMTESPALLWTAEVMLLFAYAISQGGGVKFEQISAALFAGIAIAHSFASFLRMDAAGIARPYLLAPFVLSFACDSGAYLAGRAFGRHKLAPVVSPHKTVEGAIGGLLGNLIGGLVFAFLMRGGGPGYLRILALSLVCGVISQLGDLSFSLIKRQYGVKDYGRVFLAHGGVLDRFDSVLFVTPVVEFALFWLP